jgi:aminobutyraldehyde dehydrogenase
MSEYLETGRICIGGAWVESAGDGVQEIFNPATGKVIARAAKGVEADVNRAVDAARIAFEGSWGDATPKDRSEALLKLADQVEAHGDELARIESENVGKPVSFTLSEEIPPMIGALRFFAAGARCLEGKAAAEYAPGFTSMLRREPIGVVGSIAPWNYPLSDPTSSRLGAGPRRQPQRAPWVAFLRGP